ncbi:MAG: undecaprenyl-diphosphatase UppP [Anaerolineales bacterium]
MTILQAVLLGVVQGATEFLPISSSAHLVLLPAFFGWEFDPELEFVFDVLVQLGTIIAVIVYFRRDLWQIATAVLRGLWQRAPLEDPYARLGWLIALATVPAVVVGVLFKDFFKATFGVPTAAAGFLFVTALLLTASERRSRTRTRAITSVGWLEALFMGVLQSLAIFPGISRSGATIAGGLFRGLDRPTAARFSFLMAVPVMIGAGLVASRDLLAIHGTASYLPIILVGLVTSSIVGLASIHWLLSYLQRRSLHGFALYCALLGLAGLLTACAPARVDATVTPRTFPVGATPATRALAQQWAAAYPGEFVPAVTEYPSTIALAAAVESGELAAGVALEIPVDAGLFAVPLASTALAVVVHPSNPVESITVEEARALFTGRIREWDAVGGPALTVQVILQDEGSDVRAAFDALVLRNARPTLDAILAPNEAAVLAFVAETPNAVGVAPAVLVEQSGRALPIDGAFPGAEDYPFNADVFGLSLGEPHGALRAWLAWAQTEG